MSDISLPGHSRLGQFPISFFAIVMGLSGLTLTLRACEHALALDGRISSWALYGTVAVFAVIALQYALKLSFHPRDVVEEWAHPVRIAFFPTISISLLLMATAAAPVWPEVARPVWIAGAAAQGVLSLSVIANWIGHRPFEHVHLNPAWFIPAVGNIIVPLAGVEFGFVEVSWLFFSAGLIFWLVLLTLVVNRLIFHDPLPGRLVPTLVILIAPPAVAFIAYFRLEGEVDAFARILINVGYVFALVVVTQVPKLARLPFALSWWALSFPVAALAVASLLFAETAGSAFHLWVGFVLAGLLCAIVAVLALRTALAIQGKEICRPE
ncbi:SLAC1 anion channel family protein [Afifella marina]|uniref:Tellurite resistance protein n=1 Tax=Afifella marina DSM 2698 TaxID=1120955 RepID=A0A1G5NR17_AFIMA|nr:SLAC1 anion channel family protein [Afifella marina]MBK1624765.1 C4-dicarboxylate ABC transporter [Afifella marina DSM 2698]MBK1628577.1 C4-dicarboxylate ABC transporter [Afifella marina]MBK5915936.1 C4-dicarboxylate ABC transporter [Afifella marina]RAI20530.1 C4-dicarboxylate ABC transporter [Afifella marina DSM 2698]SCZ39822.1 tellurite resistance protein [Afifella marina DSM 2698]